MACSNSSKLKPENLKFFSEPAEPPVGRAEGDFIELGPVNLFGGDLGESTIFDAYDECGYRCMELQRCKGFTWDTQSHECFLKNGDWTSLASPIHRSGKVTKHLSDMYIRMENIEFVGGEIRGRRDSTIQRSADHCARQCMETSLCKGFTWELATSQCFLKEGGWTEEQNFGKISGILHVKK